MSDQWAQRAPLTGIAAIVFIVLAFLIGGETPDFDASTQEILDYYDDTKQFPASLLLVIGATLFVFFAATLRSAMRGAEALSTLVLVGGAIFGIGLAISAAINFTAADLAGSDNVDRIDPGALAALNAMNTDFFFPGILGLAVLYFSTALAVLATGALPRWFGWITLVLGIISLAGPAGLIAFLAVAPWTLAASILLMRGTDRAGPGAGGEGPRSEYRENPVG